MKNRKQQKVHVVKVGQHVYKTVRIKIPEIGKSPYTIVTKSSAIGKRSVFANRFRTFKTVRTIGGIKKTELTYPYTLP